MSDELSPDTEALWRDVEQALQLRRPSPRVVPLLVRLAQTAPVRSDAWRVATRELAVRLVDRDPWRASLLVRRVVRVHRDDDGAWALLGLAQSLLGNNRFAVRAYRQALRLAPHNPWYAHNLGHLYDAVLDRPIQALPLLRRSLDQLGRLPEHERARYSKVRHEVIASYAHALLRSGDSLSARRVMREVVRGSATPAHHALYRRILDVHDRCVESAQARAPRGAQAARRRWRKRRRTRC